METVQTPLDILNIAAGGGLRWATLTELYGPQKSGKSAFMYDCAGRFLKQFPKDSKVFLIDPELASDDIRLEYVFGIPVNNKNKFEKVSVTTVENGFKMIIEKVEALKKNERLMILWDTIAVCPTDNEFENVGDQYAGGRQEKPRVVKHYLTQLMVRIYGKKVIIMFPNQIYIGDHGAHKSGLGESFKHDVHYSFKFTTEKNLYDTNGKDIIYSLKRVTVAKSRFLPEFQKLPMYIDSQAGGRINYKTSTILAAVEYGYIIDKKGWYKLPGDETDKAYRWSEIISQHSLYLRFFNQLLDNLKAKYMLIRIMIDKLKQEIHPRGSETDGLSGKLEEASELVAKGADKPTEHVQEVQVEKKKKTTRKRKTKKNYGK